MPELAEVFYYASQWKRAAGERFELERLSLTARCCRALGKEAAQEAFSGVTLLDGYTHGKRMLFAFDGGVYLEVHLGMTGALRREALGARLEKHDHFALTSGRSMLVFRDPRQFGKLALHRSREVPAWWLELPPQPLDKAFTRRRLAAACELRGRRPLKSFLLDQEHFPGVGNWMADEILWQARLRPSRRVASLDDEERENLFGSIQQVCRVAMETVGKDYRDPPEDWLFHCRWRAGGTCPKTGKSLARETIGGRCTCWSPTWQH